jgi:hypothetical protein
MPTTSSFGRTPGGSSTMPRARIRIAITMNTSPTKTYRQLQYVVKRPPISGPTATATAPAAETSPYALGLASAGEVRGDSATTAGRISAAPTLEERPADDEDGQRVRERVVNEPTP